MVGRVEHVGLRLAAAERVGDRERTQIARQAEPVLPVVAGQVAPVAVHLALAKVVMVVAQVQRPFPRESPADPRAGVPARLDLPTVAAIGDGGESQARPRMRVAFRQAAGNVQHQAGCDDQAGPHIHQAQFSQVFAVFQPVGNAAWNGLAARLLHRVHLAAQHTHLGADHQPVPLPAIADRRAPQRTLS